MSAAKSTALSVVRREDADQLTFEQTMQLGEVLAKSGYFTDAKEQAQAVAKILAGRELGLGPMMSMSGVYIINGKAVLSASLMASAIKRSGKYDYRVREHSNDRCSIEFFQASESLGISKFDKEDAQVAGVLEGTNKHTWKKFPRNMLFARAMSNGARFYTPDIFGGPVYDPDEIGAGLDGQTGEYIPTTRTDLLLSPKQAPDGNESPDNKLTDEVRELIKTLGKMGHSSFTPGSGSRERILDHVRSIADDRMWSYTEISSLSDLSPEHLNDYAGVLEGEIEAMKDLEVESGGN